MVTSNLNTSYCTSSYSIQSLPIGQRPRERMLMLGPDAVSSIELLMIVLGSGTQGMTVIQLAQELMGKFGSLHAISEATIPELCMTRGMGATKAAQLKAAFTLGVRASKDEGTVRKCVKNPQQAYLLLKDELMHARCEHFMAILLDTKSCVIAVEKVAIGTLSQVQIHPREVFYQAIRHTAASLILAHNHPSGDPSPSKEDVEVTAGLIEAGKVMGIPVQDHLIIGKDRFLSLRQVCAELRFG